MKREAAKVITDLQAQINGLKGQLNLYRWSMVMVAIGLTGVLFGLLSEERFLSGTGPTRL